MSQQTNGQPVGNDEQMKDAAKPETIGDAKKTEPPAPRRRRRYDPVLQPPEKTRVP